MVQLKIISPCETIGKLNEFIPKVEAYTENWTKIFIRE